jgi:hypothetical protein
MTTTTLIHTFPAPKTDAQCEQLWFELLSAANAASLEWLNPESGITRYPGGLGSAWVKLPNRGAFAKWLVRKDYAWVTSGSGLNISCRERDGFPSTGQSESHAVHVTRAVTDRLRAYGILAQISSYNS